MSLPTLSQSTERFSYEQLLELSKDAERHQLEFKSACYIVLEHPGNLNNRCKECGSSRPVTDQEQLRHRCRRMLAEVLSAFANSNGGTLVIGMNDSGKPDKISVPEYYRPQKRTADWISDLIRQECIDPPLSDVEPYSVDGPDGARLLVVTVKRSELAPHQSLPDRCYFVRVGRSIEKADHWLVELLRSRRIHPVLIAEGDPTNAVVASIKGSREDYKDVAIIRLPISIRNAGTVIARDWACTFECPFAYTTRVTPPDFFNHTALPLEPNSNFTVSGARPLYPLQSVTAVVELHLPVYVSVDGQNSSFSLREVNDHPPGAWGDDKDGWASRYFRLIVRIFADSAPSVSFAFSMRERDLWTEMVNARRKTR